MAACEMPGVLPPVRSYLQPCDLTPEARETRYRIARQLNRCPHDVNVLARRCPACDAAGECHLPAGVNSTV